MNELVGVIDYVSMGLERGPRLTDAERDTLARHFASFRDLAAKSTTELFLLESPYNHYQPPVPPGHFGMRSHKRRVFMAMVETPGGSLRIPEPAVIQDRLKHGIYTEAPL